MTEPLTIADLKAKAADFAAYHDEPLSHDELHGHLDECAGLLAAAVEMLEGADAALRARVGTRLCPECEGAMPLPQPKADTSTICRDTLAYIREVEGRVAEQQESLSKVAEVLLNHKSYMGELEARVKALEEQDKACTKGGIEISSWVRELTDDLTKLEARFDAEKIGSDEHWKQIEGRLSKHERHPSKWHDPDDHPEDCPGCHAPWSACHCPDPNDAIGGAADHKGATS